MQSRFQRWDDARLFLAVARQGSTLAASRLLGLTQTTVARRIDALEHALGLTLFDRDTRGFHLTPEGAALVATAQAMDQAASAFASAAEDQRGARSRPIRFTTWGDSMNQDIADVFADFTAANPGAVFEFVTSEKPLDLAAGEADVALRLGGNIGDPSLIGRRVGSTWWTYFASEQYARTHALPQQFSPDFEEHTVILLRHIPTDRKNVMLCNSSSDQIMAIKTGRGIGPLPTAQGDRIPGLVRCFPPPENAELFAHLLASPAAYRRQEVRRFMAFAAPRFASYLKAAAPR